MVLPDEARQTVVSYLTHQGKKDVPAVVEVIERERRRLLDLLADVSPGAGRVRAVAGPVVASGMIVEHVVAAERGVVEHHRSPGRCRRAPRAGPPAAGRSLAELREDLASRASAAPGFGERPPSGCQPRRQARSSLLRAAELEGVAGLPARARRGPHRSRSRLSNARHPIRRRSSAAAACCERGGFGYNRMRRRSGRLGDLSGAGRSGGIGRRDSLKNCWGATPVPVRVRPSAPAIGVGAGGGKADLPPLLLRPRQAGLGAG